MFSLRAELVFYDLTSTYFEGAGPEGLAAQGALHGVQGRRTLHRKSRLQRREGHRLAFEPGEARRRPKPKRSTLGKPYTIPGNPCRTDTPAAPFLKNAVLSSAVVYASSARAALGASTDWRYYGGSAGATRYSSLDQIDSSNVGELKVAWTHSTGDAMQRPTTKIECTPIVVDGRMYITTAQLQVRALDAVTGKMLWNFDPYEGVRMRRSKGVNRGVSYWADGDNRRIFMSAQEKMFCLDADTGKLVSEFADGGVLNMKEGLDRDFADNTRYFYATPPVIFEDMLLLGGGSGSEGPGPAAPGHIRGFDVRTGKRLWIFHTIPHPGEFGL